MTWRERTLLALTVVGFVVPHVMGLALVPLAIEHGPDLVLQGEFFTVFFEMLPAAQLAADVILAFGAFVLWAAWEGRRLGMRSWWVPLPRPGRWWRRASPFPSSCSCASALCAAARDHPRRSRREHRQVGGPRPSRPSA